MIDLPESLRWPVAVLGGFAVLIGLDYLVCWAIDACRARRRKTATHQKPLPELVKDLVAAELPAVMPTGSREAYEAEVAAAQQTTVTYTAGGAPAPIPIVGLVSVQGPCMCPRCRQRRLYAKATRCELN